MRNTVHSDVAKNSNIKVFNLVSRVNKTRRIEWHEMRKCECRFNSTVCNKEKRWNDDKCRCECKDLNDKGACDKGFIWNSSNCECECYKSCGFSEYLDYKSCKCKRRLVDKLAKQCTKIIEETKLVEITLAKNKNKHKCTLYIVLFSIYFTFNVGIGSYFLCFYWHLKKDVICIEFGTRTQTTI